MRPHAAGPIDAARYPPNPTVFCEPNAVQTVSADECKRCMISGMRGHGTCRNAGISPETSFLRVLTHPMPRCTPRAIHNPMDRANECTQSVPLIEHIACAAPRSVLTPGCGSHRWTSKACANRICSAAYQHSEQGNARQTALFAWHTRHMSASKCCKLPGASLTAAFAVRGAAGRAKRAIRAETRPFPRVAHCRRRGAVRTQYSTERSASRCMS